MIEEAYGWLTPYAFGFGLTFVLGLPVVHKPTGTQGCQWQIGLMLGPVNFMLSYTHV